MGSGIPSYHLHKLKAHGIDLLSTMEGSSAGVDESTQISSDLLDMNLAGEQDKSAPTGGGCEVDSKADDAIATLETCRNGHSEMFYKFAKISCDHIIDEMRLKSKCEFCFLTQKLCVCNKIREFFSSASPMKSHVSVFMHYKEWGRASNTGKILLVGRPSNSSLFIFGKESDEQRLIRKLTATPSLILYPKNSRPIHEFQDWFAEHDGDVNICVLDSTWTQSEAMDRIIPKSIPRVHVDLQSSNTPSLFLNRKQSKNKAKVCTVEAVAYALQSMGEQLEAVQPIISSLQHCVDAVLLQRGKKIAYNSQVEMSDAPDVRWDRPTLCSRCGTTKGFKNLGLRWCKASEIDECLKTFARHLEMLYVKCDTGCKSDGSGSANVSSGVGTVSDNKDNSCSDRNSVSISDAGVTGDSKDDEGDEDGVDDDLTNAENAPAFGAAFKGCSDDSMRYADPLYRIWRCRRCNEFFAIQIR